MGVRSREVKVAPSSAAASDRMKRQRLRGTGAELAVRRSARAAGLAFRVDNRDLPGSPDLANRRRRWAVFVHGCFWHAHEGCKRATMPKANQEFWATKFAANRERDDRKHRELTADGFNVLVVWECELADVPAVTARLGRLPRSLP